MATRRFSIAQGGSHLKAAASNGVTEAAGAAVVTASMEFTYDRAQSLRKSDILHGLMEIYHHIKKHSALPL